MELLKPADLSRVLSDGITSGRFAVGTLLPTEFELCEQYGLSRYAVRIALNELQDLGMISRRKNVGTRVEATRPAAGFVQSLDSVEDLAQFGATHVRVVRSVEEVIVDLALAKTLGCAGGSRWLRISSVRMDGDRKRTPMCWTDAYIDAAYGDIGDLAKQAPQALLSSLIEERYGRRIARIRQDINAMTVPKSLADEMKVEVNSPALKVVRRYLDSSDEAFEITVSVHPADRFTFSMELNRSVAKTVERAGTAS